MSGPCQVGHVIWPAHEPVFRHRRLVCLRCGVEMEGIIAEIGGKLWFREKPQEAKSDSGDASEHGKTGQNAGIPLPISDE
jgi:hypothetical protein